MYLVTKWLQKLKNMSKKEELAIEALCKIHKLLADGHHTIQWYGNRKDFKSTAILATDMLNKIMMMDMPIDDELEKELEKTSGKDYGIADCLYLPRDIKSK